MSSIFMGQHPGLFMKSGAESVMVAAVEAKRLAKEALAGPVVKKEKVKKEKVVKEKIKTEKVKKIKPTKEELGRQDSKKGK